MRTAALFLVCLLVPASAPAGLNPSFSGSGSLGLEVAGVGGGNGAVAMGNLNLNNLPPSALIQKATLYASQTNQGTSLDAVFAGSNLGSVGPTGVDAAFVTMYSYHWDVTLLVTGGINSYAFTIGANSPGATAIAGVALSVVWSDAGEPNRSVELYDGMRQVGESGAETESVVFTGLSGGSTTAWVFTVNDDGASSMETVTYNGNVIGGPLDSNNGLNASLLQMSTTSSGSGSDTLSINTGADHMGWMIGAVAVDNTPVSTRRTTWGRLKRTF